MGSDFENELRRALARPGAPSSDLDLNHGVAGQRSTGLTPAGVLIAIRRSHGQVILTKRSAHLKHHPGQIAFPGGKQDPGDATPEAAALREACEEIGLPPQDADVIGQMSPHQTVTNYNVHPVVALVPDDFEPVPEAGEVSEIFDVPLAHLMDVNNYRTESRYWQGHRRFYYTVPYGPYYIWGATARILRALADQATS